MHPTIDEQLAGADRLLDLVAADGLSPSATQALTNARRLLTQVGRSWAVVLPFHRDRSAALADLLTRLAPLVPAAGVVVEPAPADATDVAAAAAHDAALRDQLSRLIAALPDSPDGAAARVQIADHLAARVAADPS